MPRYRFVAQLTPEQVLAYYRGHARSVLVITELGVRVQLDLLHFQPYFTHQGLDGNFELTTDANGRFLALDKII